MAQWVKVPSRKPDDLSLSRRTHELEEENQIPTCSLSLTHTHTPKHTQYTHMHLHKHMHIHIHIYIYDTCITISGLPEKKIPNLDKLPSCGNHPLSKSGF